MINNISADHKVYFLSDFHLGAPNADASLIREKKLVLFLDSIKNNAAGIFIVGDIFDFWFEYKKSVPKGYTRLLGKLAELSDAGIPIIVFTGNHDMWMSGYFESEMNITVYHEPKTFVWNNKKVLIGHGDGLGPGDQGYKFLKKVFTNPICKWLFSILHPDWGIGLANYFSRKSKEKTGLSDDHFLGADNEWLIVYSKEVLDKEHFDFFIFGHRHYPIDFPLTNNSRYINLGDWIKNFTYAEFDGTNFQLKKFES